MEYLSLHNVQNLKKIDFVKYMPNLIELDIAGTGVTDISILETQTKNGYLSKFASLGVSNKDTNLNEIQTTINNFWGRNGEYWTRIGDQTRTGLKLYTKDLIPKLNMCSSIKKMNISMDNVLVDNETYDLSNLNSLTEVTLWHVNKQIKLPNCVTKVTCAHSEHPIFEEKSILGYYSNHDATETTENGLLNLFDSLEGCSTIKTFKITADYNFHSLNGVSKLKASKIDWLCFEFLYEKNDIIDISDLANFKDGDGYIKKLKYDGEL